MIFLPLYIDPGTGSMLFSLAIGITTAGVFAVRALALKLKFVLSGGKAAKQDANKIPFVIYSDHKRYWNVFGPVCRECEKRRIPLVYLTQSADDPVFNEKFEYIKAEFIGEGNKGFARLNMLNAGIVLSTTPGLDVYQWKRSRNVGLYVHVPHTADELSGYRMFGLDFYDAVLASGKNQVELIQTIESLRPNIKRKELVTVGSLPLDNLKKRVDEKIAGASFDKLNNRPTMTEAVVEPVGTTVLLAPIWGESGMLTRFGEKMLSALSKTGFKIIVRPHPQTVVSEQNILQPLKEKFPNLEWNFDNDNFAALNRADILITDFSGIIFDFACVFDKPLIYTSSVFDSSVYDADWLTETRWCEKVLPEIGIELKEENLDKIENIIKTALESKNLQEGRDKVRAECWENIGHSAESVVDYIVKKQKELEGD